MVSLYFFACLIGIIIQIYLMIKIKKTGDAKYWNRFVGIALAWFISVILAYFVFSNNAIGLSSAVVCIFICGLSFFVNLILFIIGFLIKKSLKDDSIKLDKSLFFIIGLVVVFNVVILLIVPAILNKISLKTGEKKVIDYLDSKYGEGNYKVVNIYKEYSNSGMWDRYLSGYYYEIKSDYMDDTFLVDIDDNFSYIDEDYFLPVYYSQQYDLDYTLKYNDVFDSLDSDFEEFDNYINGIVQEQLLLEDNIIDTSVLYSDYVESWNNISGVNYNSNYDIIPSDYGEVPKLVETIRRLIAYSK